MGTGAGGNFGNTKGKSMILASLNSENVLIIHNLSNANKEIKQIASLSPIRIPSDAVYKIQNKDGYKQVKYIWDKKNVKYESRWHTQTMNAPKGTGNTYQVTKTIKGSGYGSNAKGKELFHLLKFPNGKKKWINHKDYQSALKKVKQGTASEKEKEIIKYGHIKK